MSTLNETFIDELKDTYDAEHQITKALPKMAKAAKNEDLKKAFETHLEETRGHIERLEQVFELCEESPKRKKCKAMQGLLEEGEDLIEEEEGDAALISAAQKVEHYEIAAYGSLSEWAKILGKQEACDLLEQTLTEEKQTDEKLTEIAETANAEENMEDAEAEEEKPSRRVASQKK